MKKILVMAFTIVFIISSVFSTAFACSTKNEDKYNKGRLKSWNNWNDFWDVFEDDSWGIYEDFWEDFFDTDYKESLKQLEKRLEQYKKNSKIRNKLIKEISKLKRKYGGLVYLIFVNGKEIRGDDLPPVIKDKDAGFLLPIAPIVKALGAEVKWDPKSKTATIRKGDTTVVLKYGSNKAIVNGKEVKLNSRIDIKNGKMMVPVGLLMKVFKCRVDVDEDDGSIIVDEENVVVVNDDEEGEDYNKFYYNGDWDEIKSPGSHEGDLHVSEDRGATAKISFIGTRIKLYASTGPKYGKAQFYIDGAAKGEKSFYTSKSKHNTLIFDSGELEAGYHELMVKVSGKKDKASGGTAVNIDYAEITECDVTTNLALEKDVKVSSIEKSGLEGEKAVDGDLSTRWSSEFNDDQWIKVDLGEEKAISMVKLFWEVAYAKEYKIQVSSSKTAWDSNRSSDSRWVDVYPSEDADIDSDPTSGGGRNDVVTFKPVKARYIRIKGIERATPYGYSLYELEVYSGRSSADPDDDETDDMIFEAEDAELSNGTVVDDKYDGYKGDGYVTKFSDKNATVAFTVYVDKAGNYDAIFRYANDTGSRKTLSLYINGSKMGTLQFADTGDWEEWDTVKATVTLKKGANTIALRKDARDSGGINLDNLEIADFQGALSGSIANVSGNVNLTSEGTIDWIHWGADDKNDVNSKKGAKVEISNFTVKNKNDLAWLRNSSVNYSWTDGDPDPREAENDGKVYISGADNEFRFTVPASTSERTLKVYLSAWNAQGTLEAFLDSNKANAYVVNIDAGSSEKNRVVTLTFTGAHDNDKLTVRYYVRKQDSGTGRDRIDPYRISLQAAALK